MSQEEDQSDFSFDDEIDTKLSTRLSSALLKQKHPNKVMDFSSDEVDGDEDDNGTSFTTT